MKPYGMILLAVALLFSFSCADVSAHSISQTLYLDTFQDGTDSKEVCAGSELIGWGVFDVKHLGTYTTQYKFDSSVSSENKSKFRNAVLLWKNAVPVASMTESSNGMGTVMQYAFGNLNIAALTARTPGADGHVQSWAIVLNETWPIFIEATLAHEIGHVWGLTDLYEDRNIDKLMYGYENRTARKPMEADIKGFEVATGIHTTHSWLYQNAYQYCSHCNGRKTEAHRYTWTKYSGWQHKGTCSLCGKVVYEVHEPYFTSKCLRCGETSIQKPIDRVLPSVEESCIPWGGHTDGCGLHS